MTEEELKREEEREELIAERKARYKKFDFADFVSRDKDDHKEKESGREESKGKKSKSSSRGVGGGAPAETDRMTYYSGALGAISSKMD